MSVLLLGMVLSVVTFLIHNMVTVASLLVSPDFATCLYRSPSSSLTPVALLIFQGN